jgi:DNA polymerase III subunit epsilon
MTPTESFKAAKRARLLAATFAATRGAFVVADLETTGLSPAACEILEIAAIRVDATGAQLGEFSTLVRVRYGVPYRVTDLTGITTAQAMREGIALPQAMREFMAFSQGCPLFFHNASFDTRFLAHAALELQLPFLNPTHCTLAMARALWPMLPSHKLVHLARHVGAPAPTHRGLADVRATLSVLLAARALSQPGRAAA